MKTLKYSRQRESIKASLMSRKDHPTADAVYASIREEFPNISLGTVYRNVLVHGGFGNSKLLCRLPHRGIVVYDVIGNGNGPLFNIILQRKNPSEFFFTMYEEF